MACREAHSQINATSANVQPKMVWFICRVVNISHPSFAKLLRDVKVLSDAVNLLYKNTLILVLMGVNRQQLYLCSDQMQNTNDD